MIKVTNNECENLARTVASKIRGTIAQDVGAPIPAYAVPRGGIPAAYLISKYISITLVDDISQAKIIIDDLIDSGSTRLACQEKNPKAAFFCLIDKRHDALYTNEWLVFPWEGSTEGSTEDIGTRLLEFIGEDPTREGLKETPARFIKAWQKWSEGYGQDPAKILKTFTDGAENCDEVVLVKDIPIYSHCEHHLAAIFGTAHIAYIPNGKIVGLSKLARVANCFARRLQVQERLTTQIADAIQKHLNPLGVAVVINARHFCMESRGVEKLGSSTTTSAMLGVFKEKDNAARMEFLELIK
ncbi:GTP cyclohydrolase I FolE [Candidatus Pacearchaeota archaeon]|nr:GTP cyclohydrolase I FolE [Candidatus Pacearchaeota archaeon]